MRDSTIITHADVYSEDLPSTSDNLTPEEMMRAEPCKKARCVMVSGDSPPPLQASMPLMNYDVPDEARADKSSPSTPITTKLLISDSSNEESIIEKAVHVSQTVLPSPEPQPKIQMNGLDMEQRDDTNKPDEDACLVDCIYFMQQCCECVIL